MELKMQKWGSGLVIGLFFTALVVAGCAKGDAGSSSVSNPSAVNFQPKGTIQGKVRDATTFEPIVNAVVSIGLSSDVTDANGQYILANVPATSDALNGTVSSNYDMTINLRSVNSPINMGLAVSATNPHYPDFAYRDVSVSFTSLNDAMPCSDGTNPDPAAADGGCGTNNTNHDTPVDGLATNADVLVGKMDTTVKGTLLGCPTLAGSALLPLSGYTVQLVTQGFSTQNTGTGASGNIVNTTTTDANGNFQFDFVEAYGTYAVHATDTADTASATVSGWSTTIPAPADGQTSVFLVNSPMTACNVDNLGPLVVATAPENGSDQDPSATTAVTFNFSEPVAQTPSASTDPSGVFNLADRIKVIWDATKVFGSVQEELPFTAAWNATFDQLTVTFAAGASSKYHVTILDMNTLLKDANGNPAQMGVCADDGRVPTLWASDFIDSDENDCTVYFTTNAGGVGAPAAPVISLVNQATLNQVANTTGNFDWLPVSGAKTYNFYCSIDERFADGAILPGTPLLFDGILQQSQEIYDFDSFIESAGNDIGIQYSCYVTALNSDGVESGPSNVEVAADVRGPAISTLGGYVVHDYDSDGAVDHIDLYFNEPLDEASAETAGNYAITTGEAGGATVTAAALVQQTFPTFVTLTVTTALAPADFGDDATDEIAVSGVRDVNQNVINPGSDTIHLQSGVID
jgi:hypothetical protein